MKHWLILIGVAVSMFIAGCAVAQMGVLEKTKTNFAAKKKQPQTVKHFAEFEVYDPDINAAQSVDKAMEKARMNGHKLIVVMGANWCHDSRDFAERMSKPAFQNLLKDNYEIVYISVGTKPGQKDQNALLAKRFDVYPIVGTPTVLIMDYEGNVLNKNSAGYWRHAAAIPEDMSLAYFKAYAGK